MLHEGGYLAIAQLAEPVRIAEQHRLQHPLAPARAGFAGAIARSGNARRRQRNNFGCEFPATPRRDVGSGAGRTALAAVPHRQLEHIGVEVRRAQQSQPHRQPAGMCEQYIVPQVLIGGGIGDVRGALQTRVEPLRSRCRPGRVSSSSRRPSSCRPRLLRPHEAGSAEREHRVPVHDRFGLLFARPAYADAVGGVETR